MFQNTIVVALLKGLKEIKKSQGIKKILESLKTLIEMDQIYDDMERGEHKEECS
jgi:hypothetical protein